MQARAALHHPHKDVARDRSLHHALYVFTALCCTRRKGRYYTLYTEKKEVGKEEEGSGRAAAAQVGSVFGAQNLILS